MPLAEARKEAKLLLATQIVHKATTSFPAAVDAFLADCRTKNRPKTVTEYTRYLKAYDFSGAVDDINRRDIQKHLTSYARKSARAHALVTFKIFFNWAIRHELRRTFSTIHASLGTPIHVTEKLLNHSSGTISGVAAVYNKHAYLDEMRAAVRAYEEHLAGLVAG